MYSTRCAAPARLRVLFALAACLAALALTASHASTASADCTTGSTTGCLPGSGYTFDVLYDCGTLPAYTNCFYPGYTDLGRSITHTWGWGSADYDGGGSTTVCVNMVTVFQGCGVNLVRACAQSTCNDQSVYSAVIAIATSENHTITGHAEA